MRGNMSERKLRVGEGGRREGEKKVDLISGLLRESAIHSCYVRRVANSIPHILCGDDDDDGKWSGIVWGSGG